MQSSAVTSYDHLVATAVGVTEAVGSAGMLAGGAVVIIRTVVSFSLDIEIDGVLPWQAAAPLAPPVHDVAPDIDQDPA